MEFIDRTELSKDHRQYLELKIQQSERKLLLVCQQLNILREKERELTARAIDARHAHQRGIYYNLVLRRSVVEGMVNVLNEYIRDKVEEISDLRWEVYRQIVVLGADTDDETDEEDDMLEDDFFFM